MSKLNTFIPWDKYDEKLGVLKDSISAYMITIIFALALGMMTYFTFGMADNKQSILRAVLLAAPYILSHQPDEKHTNSILETTSLVIRIMRRRQAVAQNIIHLDLYGYGIIRLLRENQLFTKRGNYGGLQIKVSMILMTSWRHSGGSQCNFLHQINE